MLSILMALRERAPVDFRLIAMNLDQKQPGFPADVLPAYLAGLGVEHLIVEQDTYSIVKEKIPEGKTTCSLCSRLRRGVIYRTAKELGANKIALGHHRDDIVHTLFLNLLFGGKLKAMPPKLLTDDGAHVVIRPLAYCAESDIAKFARGMAYPIIPCNLCGSQNNLQRQKIREMMADWDRRYPGCVFHPNTTTHSGPNPASDSGRNPPPAPLETLPPVPIQSRPPIPKQTRHAGGLM